MASTSPNNRASSSRSFRPTGVDFSLQPGGLPTADALWSDHGSRSLVEVAGEDLAAEIAQHVLGGRSVLIDAAMKLGCMCSGATAHAPTEDAREFPCVVGTAARNDSRRGREHTYRAGFASSSGATNTDRHNGCPFGVGSEWLDGCAWRELFHRHAAWLRFPTRDNRRAILPPAFVPVGGSSAVARPTDGREGKTLPRIYVARRRQSPRSAPVGSRRNRSRSQALEATRELAQKESIERMETEPFEPVAFDFGAPVSSQEIPGMELAATDKSPRAEPRSRPAGLERD